LANETMTAQLLRKFAKRSSSPLSHTMRLKMLLGGDHFSLALHHNRAGF
jgi:hypothetical protein